MPRNVSGVYSLPNGTLVTTGDTLLVSQHNPAMSDVAQALSNSLDRDGSGGMRANLSMGGFDISNAKTGTFSGFVYASNVYAAVNSGANSPIAGVSNLGALPSASFTNNGSGSTVFGVASSIAAGGNNTASYHYAGITQGVALWYLYGNGTSSYTSDARVKKNIETTRDGYLEDVCALRVVKYNWYVDDDDTPRELGFIAQEVEQVFPGLVCDALHETKDGEIHKVLKASVLVPILVKAVQELAAEVAALKALSSPMDMA